MAISYGIGATPGGMIGAGISSLVTQSQVWVSTCSTGANYLSQSAVFLILNHYSNSNCYTNSETGGIDWQKVSSNFGELAVKALIPDVILYSGRSAAVYWLQQRGMDPILASLATDIMLSPVYAGLVAFTSKQIDASAEKFGRLLKTTKSHNGTEAQIPTTEPKKPLEDIVARTEEKGKGTPTPQ